MKNPGNKPGRVSSVEEEQGEHNYFIFLLCIMVLLMILFVLSTEQKFFLVMFTGK